MTTDPDQAGPPSPGSNARASRRPRPVPLLVALAGLVVLIASGYALTSRIRDYNAANPTRIYRFINTDQTEFNYAGHPVRIADDVDEQGEGTLTIAYGDTDLDLPVQVPNPVALPGLDRHRDWFRLTIFAESTGLTTAEFKRGIDDGSIPARLVAVTRNPLSDDVREGRFDMRVDENWGWGEVLRDRWTFSFHEFLPEGGFESQTLRFPESGKSFYRRQVNADLAGEPAPVRDPNELKEGTWQFQAALALMNRPPAITMEQQALRNAGWTLPVASASVLVIMFGIAWAFAPARVTEQTADA